jgi:hypothetical protein
MKKILLFALCICMWEVPQAFAANNEEYQPPTTAGLVIFSDMKFSARKGEYYGLQIIMVPFNVDHSHSIEKILWRVGNGRLEAPLMVDYMQEKRAIRITVPEGRDQGEWLLTPEGKNGLLAQGPHGMHHELKSVVLTQ